MSIYIKGDPNPFFQIDKPEACFMCGAPLTDTSIHWMGAVMNKETHEQLSIYLHPRCALRLSRVLAKDLEAWWDSKASAQSSVDKPH